MWPPIFIFFALSGYRKFYTKEKLQYHTRAYTHAAALALSSGEHICKVNYFIEGNNTSSFRLSGFPPDIKRPVRPLLLVYTAMFGLPIDCETSVFALKGHNSGLGLWQGRSTDDTYLSPELSRIGSNGVKRYRIWGYLLQSYIQNQTVKLILS